MADSNTPFMNLMNNESIAYESGYGVNYNSSMENEERNYRTTPKKGVASDCNGPK